MMTEKMLALAERIDASQSAAILRKAHQTGELTYTIRREYLRRFMTFLLNDPGCEFRQLIDICGADYPEKDERFEVVYHLLSMVHNQRVRVKVTADPTTPVETMTTLFSAAAWFEREVWDMYGILFEGHPDLRRILTDYGFEGHPLRKDFPLTGFVEVRYDETQKRVKYEPVHLAQEYRYFDYTSPWEGMTAVQLPGDEKVVKPKILAGGDK